MLSELRTMWEVLKHTFTKAETVQYPEEMPYLAPRYRGRIVLTRDPDGEERALLVIFVRRYVRLTALPCKKIPAKTVLGIRNFFALIFLDALCVECVKRLAQRMPSN